MGFVTASAGALCVAMLWWQAAQSDSWAALFTGVGLLGTGLLWLILGSIGLLVYRRVLVSLIAPALVAGSLGLLYGNVAGKIGWRLSEGALADAAAECARTNETRRIGVYQVVQVYPSHGGCAFVVREAKTFTTGLAFAYYPSGAPPEEPRSAYVTSYTYAPLDGPWYRVEIHEPFD
ncbi:hypothetical protein AB0C65_07095 [Nocardia sp. NPDC048505]